MTWHDLLQLLCGSRSLAEFGSNVGFAPETLHESSNMFNIIFSNSKGVIFSGNIILVGLVLIVLRRQFFLNEGPVPNVKSTSRLSAYDLASRHVCLCHTRALSLLKSQGFALLLHEGRKIG